MNDDPHVFPFPPPSDAAAGTVNDFLEELCRRFQNHYFHQIRRHYAAQTARPSLASGPGNGNIPTLLDDPPF